MLSAPAFPKVPRRQKLSPEPSQSCPRPAGLPAASEHPETRSAPPSTIGAGVGMGSGLTGLPVPARSARWWVSHWGGGCRRGRTNQSCAAGLPRGGQGPWALEMASDLVPAGRGGVQVPWSRGPGAAPGPPSQLPETPSACHHTTASRKTRGGLCSAFPASPSGWSPWMRNEGVWPVLDPHGSPPCQEGCPAHWDLCVPHLWRDVLRGRWEVWRARGGAGRGWGRRQTGQ